MSDLPSCRSPSSWSRTCRKDPRITPTTPTTPVEKVPTLSLLRENEGKSKVCGSRRNWEKVKILGVGSFGTVTLEKHRITKELVAVKRLAPATRPCVDREEIVHSQLNHENVIKLFYWELGSKKNYLYLEYGLEGFLVGKVKDLNKEDAFNYFADLIKGVDYLHSRGVAHRDLKPANLLLTKNRVLKIADFGYAGVFLLNGQEILLRGTVGTLSYMAPEILGMQSYRCPPVDLWSCGIILFVMVTSLHPWDVALQHDSNYKRWVMKDLSLGLQRPWSHLCETSWSLISCLLIYDPLERLFFWRNHLHRPEPHNYHYLKISTS